MLNPCGTNTVLGRWRVLEGGGTCMSERHIQKHWEHANFPPNKILARLETNTGTWWAVKSQLKTRTYWIFNQVNVWPGRQQQWAGKYANEEGGANRGVAPCSWITDCETRTSEKVIHLTERVRQCHPGQMISMLPSGCTSPEKRRFLPLFCLWSSV